MSDYIDQRAFGKAMQAAGVHPDTKVTAEEWLQVWEGYATRRMSRLKSFVAGVADLVEGLRNKLSGHLAAEADAKAELIDLSIMRDDAKALGADDLLGRIARQRGQLKHRAEYAAYDADATRQVATNLGISVKDIEP